MAQTHLTTRSRRDQVPVPLAEPSLRWTDGQTQRAAVSPNRFARTGRITRTDDDATSPPVSPAHDLASTRSRSQSDSTATDPSGVLRAKLREQIGSTRFARFFGNGSGIVLEGQQLSIAVPSPFLAELIERRFGKLLCTLAGQILSAGASQTDTDPNGSVPIRLSIAVDRDQSVLIADRQRASRSDTSVRAPDSSNGSDSASPSSRPRQAASGPSRRLLEKVRYRLDDFLVGDSNRLAFGAAMRLVQGCDDQSLSPLFLHGPSGVGKTHLLGAIASGIAHANPVAKVRYITAEAFTNDYITAVRTGTIDRFRSIWRRVDLLCLDDVHFVAGKEGTQRELLYTLDAIGFDRARIVLASDEHPRDIAKLATRLSSRFLAGAVIKIDLPDLALIPRLIVAIAAKRQLLLNDEAVAVLVHRASQLPGCSVRDIEGLITQVQAVVRLMPASPQMERPAATTSVLDASTVRRALDVSRGTSSAPKLSRSRRPVRFETIVEEVCCLLAIDPNDLYGKGRHKRVVLGRSLIVALAREFTTMSFPEIARGLGRPSHSTVVTAHGRILGKMAREESCNIGPDFAGQSVAQVCQTLRDSIRQACTR